MQGMFLIEIICRLMQAFVAEREGAAFFLLFRCDGKIVGTGPVGDSEDGTIFGICLFYLVAHALKTAVKNFFFVKVDIENVCICDHTAAFFLSQVS